MKKAIVLFLLALSLVTAAIAAEKPLGVDQYTSVDEIATTISSFFPKVQGDVTAVQGDRLTIGVGAKSGLQNGVTLTLWRDGKEILHPVTGAVIGRAEDEVGTVEVTAVEEKTSIGIMSKKLKDPRPGDRARITPKKIAIALIPLRTDKPEIIQGIAQRLAESGRFSVLDNDKTTAFLKDRKQRDSSLIKEMGKTFALDVVGAIEVFPTEDKFLVTTRVFYADDTRLLDTIVALLDLRTKKDALGEVRPFFAPSAAPVKKDAKVSAVANAQAKMPLDSELFAVADLEGSGKPQYVLSDGKKIHIYRQEGSGWRESWEELGVFSTDVKQIFNVDVADINGNGRPEIFVTCMLYGRVMSYVIEFKDGVYTRIAEVPGFLRIVKYPRTGNMLIGQDYNPRSFYAGQPKEYSWSGSTYVPGAEYALPKGVPLYGFAYAELAEGAPMLVALEDVEEHLIVYSNNTPIWKSEEKYPSVGLMVQKPLTGVDAMIADNPAADNRTEVRIAGRVVALDLNNDGRDEIILPKNSGKTILTPHNKAVLVGLFWNGSRLEERWKIKEDSGAVQDYQVLRLEGAGAQIVALVRHPGGFFKSDHMSIMTYEMK